MIEVELDPRTALELTGDRLLYSFEQCKVCAKLYDPSLGHKCEMYSPKTRGDVIKGILACMIDGCSNQCPYWIMSRAQQRLLNGHPTDYHCKKHLTNDIQRMFRSEVEEV